MQAAEPFRLEMGSRAAVYRVYNEETTAVLGSKELIKHNKYSASCYARKKAPALLLNVPIQQFYKCSTIKTQAR